MGWILLVAALATIALVIALAGKNANSKQGATDNLDRRIGEMERSAVALEVQISAMDQEIDDGSALPDEDDAIALNYAGPKMGPDFTFGEMAIPLSIQYVDGQGRRSEREITVQRYSYGPTGGVLAAYCHKRGAKRSFYFTRIAQAKCTETGEHITSLGPWLDVAFKSTPPGKAGSLLQEHIHALTALFFVAKADGAFRAKEKACVVQFLREVSPEVTLDDGIAERITAELGKWAVPSAIAYGKTLTALQPRDRIYRHHVIRAARNIVASDRTMAHAEDTALKRMTSALE